MKVYRKNSGLSVVLGLSLLGLSWGLSLGVSGEEVFTPANPFVGLDTLVVSDQGVALFDRGQDLARWHVLTGEQTYEPVITGSLIMVGSSKGLYAINKADGSLRWHQKVSTTAVYSPLVIDDLAYSGGTDGILRAVSVSEGATQWFREFPGWIYSPARVGDLLVVGGNHGVVWAVDRSGNSVWDFELNDDELVYQPVSIGNDRAVISTFSGRVLLLDASGNLLWQLQVASPVKRVDVQGEQLLLHRFGGIVSRVDTQSGELIDNHQLRGGLTYAASWLNHAWWISDDQGRISRLTQRGELSNPQRLQQRVVAAPVVMKQGLMLPVRQGGQIRLLPVSSTGI